jgi:hypothetical protein
MNEIPRPWIVIDISSNYLRVMARRRASSTESTMARLDPNLIPDRFALDRYARRMRREETDRMLRAVAQWLSRARVTAAARSAAARPVAPAP